MLCSLRILSAVSLFFMLHRVKVHKSNHVNERKSTEIVESYAEAYFDSKSSPVYKHGGENLQCYSADRILQM